MSYLTLAIVITLVTLFLFFFIREVMEFNSSVFPFFSRRNWRERVRRDLRIGEETWSNFTDSEKALFRDTYLHCMADDVEMVVSSGIRLRESGQDNSVKSCYSRFTLYRESSLVGRLEVAIGGDKKEWMESFVQSTCQMDQWLSNSSSYMMMRLCGKEDCGDVLRRWVLGGDLSSWELEKATRSIIRVELDCCRRSVEKIGRYGLDLDLDGYVKRSNSMIGFYGFARANRLWYNMAPNLVEKVWSRQYDVFLEEDDYLECRHCDVGLYHRHCILGLEFYGTIG